MINSDNQEKDRLDTICQIGRAFLRYPDLHFVLITYLQLRLDAMLGAGPRSAEGLGDQIGKGPTMARRGIRILLQLGIIDVQHSGQDGRSFQVLEELYPQQRTWLNGIATGRVSVDPVNGRITALKTGKSYVFNRMEKRFVEDGTPAEVTGNALPQVVTDYQAPPTPAAGGNLNAAIELQESASGDSAVEAESVHISLVNTSTAFKDKSSISTRIKQPKKAKYDPRTDELRPAIERIQAAANEAFGYERKLLNSKDEEIGRTRSGPGRYGLIRRALTDWELSEEYIIGALRLMATDKDRRNFGYLDTINIFRHLATLQQYGDAWQRGETEWVGRKSEKFDRRATHLAKVPGQTRTIAEEF